jgi:hypothetical protein
MTRRTVAPVVVGYVAGFWASMFLGSECVFGVAGSGSGGSQ